MNRFFMILVLLWPIFISNAYANDEAIKAALERLELQMKTVTASPIPGLKAVVTKQGIFYVSQDGKYVFQGTVYDIGGQRPTNITTPLLMGDVEELKDKMIIYKAPKEKHVITVFTDITCMYCHKLHENIAGYNQKGITVRYLAFPREGVVDPKDSFTPTGKKMAAIWCSDDPKKALDEAMKVKTEEKVTAPTDNKDTEKMLANAEKCKADVKEQHRLGFLFNLQGTPGILLKDGTLIAGYQDPDSLEKLLTEHEKPQQPKAEKKQ